jgi:hypothetical protein
VKRRTHAERGRPARQWGLTTFTDPVLVTDQILMGPYLIVHDDAKMERGEPCTTFYRFDPATGPKEEVVSFHCTPINRKLTDAISLFQIDPSANLRHPPVDEYQFAGDCGYFSDQAVAAEKNDDCHCRRDRRGRLARSL